MEPRPVSAVPGYALRRLARLTMAFPVALALALALGLPVPGAASQHADGAEAPGRPWFVTVSYGFGTDGNIEEIPEIAPGSRFVRSFFVDLAAGREIWRIFEPLALEVEGHAIKHFGIQTHFEFDAALGLRWHAFPWDAYVDTSFAVFNGLSWATRKPEIEVTRRGKSARLLNYLAFEFDFSLPGRPEWALALRLHHRSGVFGIFDGVDGGSNFYTLGVRYRF